MEHNHSHWMLQAIEEGTRFRGRTHPNPPVGCVLVRDGVLRGRGGHRRAGGPHGEIEALLTCEDARGATAYVTLEPCNHHGRTGPCVEALIQAGVSRVVVGVLDPNPHVNGGGCAALRAAGIEVIVGVEQARSEALMGPFLRGARKGLPYVTLKVAATLDGRSGDPSGSQVWITGPLAQERVHEERNRVNGILIGSGTVLADDPLLTTRLQNVKDVHQPLRIVLDRRLRTPLSAAIVQGAEETPTRIYTLDTSDLSARKALEAYGVEVVCMKMGGGEGDFLTQVMHHLSADGVQHVLSEAGPQLAASLLAGKWVSEVLWFVAPTFGGDPYQSALNGVVTDSLGDPVRLTQTSVRALGDDLCVHGYLPD